jgi:YD repeat-containing protein
MTRDTRPDIPLGLTYDDNGHVLTYKDSIGYSYEFTRDTRGHVLTYKDSDGLSYEYTRDTRGHVLTFKDSDDYSYERTYDTHGNEQTYKNSNGASWAAIAHSAPYTLGYYARTHLYHAGCRKFTRAEALAHWGTPREDNTERAALFHAAVTNHKESEEAV